jgi:gliding motility-associated-like protein
MVFTKGSKFMRIGLLCIILAVIGMQMSFGQNSFHRNYPSTFDKNVLALSSTQLKSGDYVTLEAQIDFDTNNEAYADTIIITSYKPKGDIKWTKSISFGTEYRGFQFILSSIVQGSNDSIYYSLFSRNLSNPNILIGSVSTQGDLGFLKSYGTELNAGNALASSNLLGDFNRSLFNSYSYIKENKQDISLSRKNYSGNELWSKSLTVKVNDTIDLDETVISMAINKDSTLLLTGIVDSNNVSPFLLVVDTLGNPILSRRYTDIQSLLSIPFSYSAKQLPDSTYILGGYLIEVVFPLNFLIRGFIIKTDKIGEVVWSKKVIFNNFDQTIINNLIVDDNEHIIVSGMNMELDSTFGYNFAAKFDVDGNVIWKKKYPRAQSILNLNGNLFNTSDRGYALSTTAVKNDILLPSFLKLDRDGNTSCEENIVEEIFFDNSFVSDTLVWSTNDEILLSQNVMKTESIFEYDVPVLELNIKTFCPNEPIDWTFSATTEGATFYKWSTGLEGATADSLRVFEEGEYSVTVTIGEDVCYMLCDTVKLDRYTEPGAEINLSLGNFCTNGKQTLRLGYQAGHPEIKSINWSTGEMGVGNIEIANPGTYSVTIVDQCDETADAKIDVGPFPTKITAATISDQIAVNCLNGTISGILSAQGNSTGLGTETYLWSNGAGTKEISINDSNILTFTVTVTDGCGTTATAIKVIELRGAGISSVTIQEDDSRKCSERIVTLNAVTNVFSPRAVYQWSTGANTGNIVLNNVSAPTTYSVTVTDLCRNTATAAYMFNPKSGMAPTVRIGVEGLEPCQEFELTVISASGDISKLPFLWNNGATTQSIKSIEQGTFSVTVTDFCDNKIIAETKVDDPKIGFKDIVYANIFFPDGAILASRATADTTEQAINTALYNRTFGPIPQAIYCLDQITDYEFYVFNRWGQLVFESKNVRDEWNGEHNDEKAPTETYMWVTKYTIFGIEKVKKGSVTLLRP